MRQPTDLRSTLGLTSHNIVTKSFRKHSPDSEKYSSFGRTKTDREVSPPSASSADKKAARSAMDLFTHKEKRKPLQDGSDANGSKINSTSKTRSGSKNAPKAVPAARLEIDMESPPLVFYGTTSQSSGALLSAQLSLIITEPEVTLDALDMVLEAAVTARKPVAKDCLDCKVKTTELKKWNFLSEPKTFSKGVHALPFSYLLPGHLPATSRSDLGNIDYVLKASAIRSNTSVSSSIANTENEPIAVQRPLVVQRALMPGTDRSAIRVFPPTNLTTTVHVPSIIHPIGTFPVQMRLSGVVDSTLKDLQRRWRIRKVSWHIEESTRFISIACQKHTATKLGGENKGILHEACRTIGSGHMSTGWKTDYSADGGQIELEWDASIKVPSSSNSTPPVCAVDSPTSLTATHALILEIIVVEEQTTTRGGQYATPTGGARVLRMSFKLTLTERAGMGISWDEEMPPMYEDVPVSPPGYHRVEGEMLPVMPEEDIEGMRRAMGDL